MKKAAILVLILCFAPALIWAADSNKDPGGFQGIKWGTPIYQLKGRACSTTGVCPKLVNGVKLSARFEVTGDGFGIYRVNLTGTVISTPSYNRMKGIVEALWKKYGNNDYFCAKGKTEYLLWLLGTTYIYVRLPRLIGETFELRYGNIEQDNGTMDPDNLRHLIRMFKACKGSV
jgi:hypothetical protein